jgi:copper chaperone CopZ
MLLNEKTFQQSGPCYSTMPTDCQKLFKSKMDCADCVRHVQHAIARVPGVGSVDVFLASEKAVVRFEPGMVDLPAIRQAVEGAGYGIGDAEHQLVAQHAHQPTGIDPIVLLDRAPTLKGRRIYLVGRRPIIQDDAQTRREKSRDCRR